MSIPKEDERTPGLDDLPDALDFLSEINAHPGAWCFMYEGEDGNSWIQGSTAPDQAAAGVSSLREALAPFAKAAERYDTEPGHVIHDNVELWQFGQRIDFLTVGDLRRARAALNGVTQSAKPTEISMTEAQIKNMVDRFLSWKLPESFNPDGGINFERTFNEHTLHPSKHEPYGTNLFNFDEATAMVRHMLEGLSSTEVEKISTDTEETERRAR